MKFSTRCARAARHTRVVPLAAGALATLLTSACNLPRGGTEGASASAVTAGPPVTIGLTFPQNGVFIPGALGGHVWIPDGALGLCRLDPGVNPGTFILTNCDRTAASPAQAIYDPVSGFAYVADASSRSNNVVRLRFDRTREVVNGSAVLAFTPPNGPNGTVGRTSAVALGPDGALYAGFIKSASIMRYSNPTANSPNPSLSSIIGQTSDGKGVKGGMVFFGHDLYIAELGGPSITIIPGADATATIPCTGSCVAVASSIVANAARTVATDGTYLYVGDAPAVGASGVLRYNPRTQIQDLFSTQHAPITAPDGSTVTTYQGICGLTAVPGPNGTDLYVGEDPTAGMTTGVGRLWLLPAGSAPDTVGAPGAPRVLPPSTSIGGPARLYAWGITAPKGGVALLPSTTGAGHLWVPDHAQGICRLDPVPGTTIFATNPNFCDDGAIGSPGQIVLDTRANPDGTLWLYIAQNDVKSPGVWRLRYHPDTESLDVPELMAPGQGLDGARANGLALGPDGNLYVGTLRDGQIRRILNPTGDTRLQTLEVVATTTDGRGINGTIAFLGADLYLPENNAATVVTNAAGCRASSTSPGGCATVALPVGTPGAFFASAIATDPARGVVYVSTSPGGANATIFRYNPASRVADIYASAGAVPAAGSPESVVYCSLTCTRPADPALTPGGTTGFHFASGLYVDPAGTLYITDDPTAGARAMRGHVWAVNPL